MKKLICRVLLVLIFSVSYLISPLTVDAASKTMRDLRNGLASLKSQKSSNANKKTQTEGEINAKKNSIVQANKEKEENAQAVEAAKQKVIESQEEIERVTEEMNQLFRYIQISNGESAYLEYISGAESTTDLVMRSAVSEQLSNYQDEEMKKLEKMIKENEELQIQLSDRNAELEKAIGDYEQRIDSLGSYLNELSEITMDINDQISAQSNLINYYESIGCKDNQTLEQCDANSTDSRLVKPLQKGTVTSLFGYRTLNGVYKFHGGIDIGGNSEGTNVYAAASGTVSAVTVKSSCGGNIVYIHHNIISGSGVTKYTTQYAHLLSIKVRVGQKVNNQTVIGTIGGGSQTRSWDRCSTGAHLHFGVGTGHYLSDYYSWSAWTSHLIAAPQIKNVKKYSWSSRY